MYPGDRVDVVLTQSFKNDSLLARRSVSETVVQSLRSYRAMGFDYVMVRHIVGDHQLMLRSFERIGRDVMPRIRDL